MKSLYLRILHWLIGAREMRFPGGVLRFTRRGDAEVEFTTPNNYHVGDTVTLFMPGDRRSFKRPIYFRVVKTTVTEDNELRVMAERKVV